jgi:hypothetical protein
VAEGDRFIAEQRGSRLASSNRKNSGSLAFGVAATYHCPYCAVGITLFVKKVIYFVEDSFHFPRALFVPRAAGKEWLVVAPPR